jgi:hypothetical protein
MSNKLSGLPLRIHSCKLLLNFQCGPATLVEVAGPLQANTTCIFLSLSKAARRVGFAIPCFFFLANVISDFQADISIRCLTESAGGIHVWRQSVLRMRNSHQHCQPVPPNGKN